MGSKFLLNSSLAIFFLTICSTSIEAQNAVCGPEESTAFVLLTSHQLDKMDPVSSVLTFNLSACIEGCTDDPRCLALKIHNSPNNDFCSYYHQTSNSSLKISDDETNLYYLQKSCFKDACKRLFVFESVAGKELRTPADSVLPNLTEKECLQKCLSQSAPVCLSASYDQSTGECQLRSSSRFTHSDDFVPSERNIRYFDNNCRDELPLRPKYEIKAKDLASHFSDTDYTGISLFECADLCQSNPDYPCRAFFFGQTVLGQFCGLMHLNLKTVSSLPGGTFPVAGVNMYEPIMTPKKNCSGDSVNFVLQSGITISADPLSSVPLASPADCLSRCRKDPQCLAASVDYGNAKCSLHGIVRPSELTNDSMVNIYRKVCLESEVKCARDWAFEKMEGQMLISADKVLETFDARGCMVACLEEQRFGCRSFDYDEVTGKCRLSRLDRFSMNLKLIDRRDFIVPSHPAQITYFENNCFIEPKQFCLFEPTKGIDIVSHDALVVDGISTEDDCKLACQRQTGFNCRRYSYMSSSGLCMLTHYTANTAPASSVIHHESDSIYGEVLNCYNVSLECGGVMTARVQSNREYDGVIYAKGKSDNKDCGQSVKQKFSFELSLPLALRTVETCNTYSDEEGEFKNTIVLQHNAHVMTAYDQTFGLQCKYDLHAKEELTQMVNISSPLSALASASKETIRHRVRTPKIHMKVFTANGAEISSAELGSELIVRIEMDDLDDVFGLSIRNMFAMDGRKKNNMTLIDSQGCPAENLIRNFRQLDPRTLQAVMEVFAFPDDNQIVLEAEVQTCRHRCKPVICMNGAESYGKRKRRSAGELVEADDANSETAVARSTIRKTVTITSQKFSLPLTGDKTIKISVTGLKSADLDGLMCFVPHIVAVLTIGWFLTEVAAVSTGCVFRKRAGEIKEKLRGTEGYYTFGRYQTVARRPRAVTMTNSFPESQGCSSC